MILTLKYHESKTLPVKAALLRGADPLVWLREIACWNIAPADLVCLLMPSSVADTSAGGLFVIFRDLSKASKLNLLEPFGAVGEKLFIPCNAAIYPQVETHEWKNILLWEWQVFHPAIGLVGFEKKDETALTDLVEYTAPLDRDWSYANPGYVDPPLLNAITVVPPTAEELIQQVKEDINQKPLDQIPENKSVEPSVVEKMTDSIKRGILKGLAGILGGVAGAAGGLAGGMAGSDTSGGGGTGSGGMKDGPLSKFIKWINRNLEELEAKRRTELQRLLRLFEDNPDEALQYALPLNSPYMDRGTGPQSDTLSRNPVNFNLGGLGGGGRGDYWNVGEYYGTLRNKYLRAAEKETYNKNYKKAAYIYAHLLGDYTAAANVLEQGQLFREAAALYRDHLKNKTAAAQCLERGGLTLEAIELYKELEQFEKTGDLYIALDQQDHAMQYYERSAQILLDKEDYVDAARITREKIHEQEKARKILLKGWYRSARHETCLQQYFETAEESSDEAQEKILRKVYQSYTPAGRKIALLNVMEQLKKKNREAVFAETSNEIAYEIVHEEAEKGNLRMLQRLNSFLRHDRLIGSDTSRYVNNTRNAPLRNDRFPFIQLDDTIRWVRACWHRNQFLAVGLKNQQLYMARGNWYGNLEYYTWEQTVKPGAMIELINAPYRSNEIILNAGQGFAVNTKQLARNKYFNDPLRVFCPLSMQQERTLCAIKENDEVCLLSVMNGDISLHFQSIADGRLIRSTAIEFEDPEMQLNGLYGNLQMVYKNQFLYSAWGQAITVLSLSGRLKTEKLFTGVRLFGASESFATLYLVISTNSGCILCKPDGLDINKGKDFFAVEIIPSLITFIKSELFVLVQKTKLFLYQITDEKPVQVTMVEAPSAVIAVFPGTDRNHFSALDENGKLTWFEIQESYAL